LRARLRSSMPHGVYRVSCCFLFPGPTLVRRVLAGLDAEAGGWCMRSDRLHRAMCCGIVCGGLVRGRQGANGGQVRLPTRAQCSCEVLPPPTPARMEVCCLLALWPTCGVKCCCRGDWGIQECCEDVLLVPSAGSRLALCGVLCAGAAVLGPCFAVLEPSALQGEGGSRGRRRGAASHGVAH